ncbi:MAG: flagellar biosynthetic protein FliR [Burkholderiales bacterium]|nr:flagellar biosynthetic protein FliR [Burkholderiales bacterium]
MNLLAADIVERFYSFLWPMLRISALLMAAPIFSLRALNLRIRILLALSLTWLVYPLHTWPHIDPVSAEGTVEIFNQIAIGLLMGLTLQVVTSALLVAGQSISNAVGLSFANMIDPNLGNVPVLAQFLLILSTLIFVGLGGHALLLGLVIESFTSMPIGAPLVSQGAWAHLVTWSSMIFMGAVLTALPVMVTLLFINIGLGVATRAAPSLNIFSVGFPAMIVAGFAVLMLALPSIAARIQWLWMQGFVQVRSVVGIQ